MKPDLFLNNIKSSHNKEEAKKILAKKLDILLRQDPNIFMSLMYRIDVSEDDVKAALNPDSPGDPMANLTEKILDRVWEKLHSEPGLNSNRDYPEEETWP